MSEIELQRRDQDQNRNDGISNAQINYRRIAINQVLPEEISIVERNQRQNDNQAQPGENANNNPNNGSGQVMPEDAYYIPDIKLYEISEQLKKLLEKNQIPIPVENSKFKHKITPDKEIQYYGELLNLKFNKDQIKFFNEDVGCLSGIQFQNLNNQQDQNVNAGQDKDNLFFQGHGHKISRSQFYTGQFFFGMMHGQGTLLKFQNLDKIDKDQKYFFGRKYDDHFNLDENEFKNIEIGNNDGKYSFKGQNKNQGIYLWKDSSKYVGDFEDKKMHGYGIMKFANGNKYIGQWKNNQMHGFGEYYWKNGDKYIGFYQQGLKYGFGHYIWASGIEYIGMYEDGVQHGYGYLKQKKHRPKLLKWKYNEPEPEKDQVQNSEL